MHKGVAMHACATHRFQTSNPPFPSSLPSSLPPGGGVVGETFFGGLHNFLSIYNIVLTGRILLSWFPQVRSGRAGMRAGRSVG